MGFLRRFRGSPGPPAEDRAAVLALLAEHGLAALDQQLHLDDLVGEADWLLDQDAGTITFGGERACPAQLLGTVSDRSRSWRWSWANESIEPTMAKDAESIRAIGAPTSRRTCAGSGWASPRRTTGRSAVTPAAAR